MRLWPDHKVEVGLGFGSELGGSDVMTRGVWPPRILQFRKCG